MLSDPSSPQADINGRVAVFVFEQMVLISLRLFQHKASHICSDNDCMASCVTVKDEQRSCIKEIVSQWDSFEYWGWLNDTSSSLSSVGYIDI